MEQHIFRKKSLDRVSSPEDLNSYLRITNPPLWFVLAAVILILIGAVVWGTFCKIETSESGVAVVHQNQAVCYVSESVIASMQVGNMVRIGEEELYVAAIASDSAAAETVLNDYSMQLAGFSRGEYVYAMSLNGELKDGNYACKVVTESISPITFLISSSN